MNKQQIGATQRIPLGYDSGRPLFAESSEVLEAFKDVKTNYRTNYHMASIWRVLMTLNADAIRGNSLNLAGNKRTIVCGHIRMVYSLDNDGSVVIRSLAISESKPEAKSGLYTVTYDDRFDEWYPEKEPRDSLNPEQAWTSQGGTAHYAAVAGKFAGIYDASSLMPEHIINGYFKAAFLVPSQKGNEYSLFWTEKGSHKSQEAAEALASVMQQGNANGLSINWLVHDEGFYTFKNAVKLIKASPLASAAERKQNANAGKAADQNVFFSNPSDSSSENSLKALCAEAGLTFVGLNANHRDLRRWSTLKNAGTEIGKSFFMAAGGGGAVTLAGIVGAGSAGKVAETGIDALISGHYYTAAACVVGTIIIGQGIYKKLLPMAASAKCTFGNGNQRWYSGDKALIKG